MFFIVSIIFNTIQIKEWELIRCENIQKAYISTLKFGVLSKIRFWQNIKKLNGPEVKGQLIWRKRNLGGSFEIIGTC